MCFYSNPAIDEVFPAAYYDHNVFSRVHLSSRVEGYGVVLSAEGRMFGGR